MKHTKYTSAPWEDNGSGLIYGQCSGDNNEAPFVADVCSNPDAYTEEEQANARLIEAAPALLAILESLTSKFLISRTRSLRRESRVIDEDLMLDETLREAVALLARVEPNAKLKQEAAAEELETDRRIIAFSWSIEDVQEIRPDLDDWRAKEVLDAIEKHENAYHGITWDTLESVAEYLYPQADTE